jgi:hypothetical protein
MQGMIDGAKGIARWNEPLTTFPIISKNYTP